ncbi:MAG: hypothetical protein MSC31_18955 [Solirubrobacteraceae bacterium MAG38_C4-C5]|nr:hypothetical protein [Candidatus Siliceabacter maunaloa]
MVVASLLVLPSATAAEAATPRLKFCKAVGGGSRTLDVLAEHSVTCRGARSVIRRTRALPRSGNGPGSPAGWGCARVTGSLLSGFTCIREPHFGAAYALPGPHGSAKRERKCNLDQLFARWGVAGTRTKGIPCSAAGNALSFWAAGTQSPRGPAGYWCTRKRVGEIDQEGGSFLAYTCKRGKLRLRFNHGGA